MKRIEHFLKLQREKTLLKFITCGSVDDGKSTLIGRLLYDSQTVYQDQLETAKKESLKYGTKGEGIDFALLVDGLQSEKEQGITIDVAYRFFSTEKKKYVIADTPGHEQYTRNMVTGASNADVAVILIDSTKGVLTQTRRHAFLVSLLGIKNIVVAVNKMDLSNYSQKRFDLIKKDFSLMFEKLIYALPYRHNDVTVKFIPISALHGENVVYGSKNMRWYDKETLIEYLDALKIEKEHSHFRFDVQYVNRAYDGYRGYCGTVLGDSISSESEIIIYPERKNAKISSIIEPKADDSLPADSKTASPQRSVTLLLDRELDISRGALFVKSEDLQPTVSDSFEAMLVWMDEEPLKKRDYFLKIYSCEASCEIAQIFYKQDVNSWEKSKGDTLRLNDIARVKVEVDRKIAFDLYESCKRTGAFIMIDKITNNTVAAGMIVDTASTETKRSKKYSEAEIALNRFIREHYPEWGCKEIKESL